MVYSHFVYVLIKKQDKGIVYSFVIQFRSGQLGSAKFCLYSKAFRE